jgi:hypothetical protein
MIETSLTAKLRHSWVKFCTVDDIAPSTSPTSALSTEDGNRKENTPAWTS